MADEELKTTTDVGETEIDIETVLADEEDLDTDTQTVDDDPEYAGLTDAQKIAKLTARNNKAARIIKKLKKPAEVTVAKPAEVKPTETKPSDSPTNQVDPFEAALLVSGMDESLVKQLKKVAALNGTSLIEAQKDPIFVTIKENFEKEQKRKDAGLGTSRGSTKIIPKKDSTTPNLSRDEHMKLAKDALGKQS